MKQNFYSFSVTEHNAISICMINYSPNFTCFSRNEAVAGSNGKLMNLHVHAHLTAAFHGFFAFVTGSSLIAVCCPSLAYLRHVWWGRVQEPVWSMKWLKSEAWVTNPSASSASKLGHAISRNGGRLKGMLSSGSVKGGRWLCLPHACG